MIAARTLHKRFGSVVAVDNVSFEAPDRMVTGVLGPNGAGKTTTLRMITGLVRPSGGRVEIDGVDPQAGHRARNNLGVLPDGAGLYQRLTAIEHLQYAARLAGLDPGAERDAIAAAIDRFELKELAARRTAGFSHGETRRVALARALLHDPHNVLLDEPTGGLDVIAARALRRLVRRLADAGKCVVMSTHIMQEATAVCDRLVVIAKGAVVAAGTPAEILAQAQCTTLEAAFLRVIGRDEALD